MALAVAAVAAVTNGETPLNVLQLLWVNLIMDAMAALGKCSLQAKTCRNSVLTVMAVVVLLLVCV